LKKQTEPMYY